jgi:hypothetical protein
MSRRRGAPPRGPCRPPRPPPRGRRPPRTPCSAPSQVVSYGGLGIGAFDEMPDISVAAFAVGCAFGFGFRRKNSISVPFFFAL